LKDEAKIGDGLEEPESDEESENDELSASGEPHPD